MARGSSARGDGALAERALCADGAVALELAIQRGRPNLELLGRVRLISAVCFQRRQDVVFFDLRERAHAPAGGDRHGKRPAHLLGQVLEVDPIAARESYGTLHGIFELADVAWPLVAQ